MSDLCYTRLMKPLQLVWLPVWFLLSFSVVGVSVTLINTLLHPDEQVMASTSEATETVTPIVPNAPQYTEEEIQGVATTVVTDDARASIVASFLKRHSSPLEPYDYFGDFLVEKADEYGIDYRLLPAIAMQESNLCKKIPEGSFNCLGFGVHSKGTLKFESYEANFDRAARELKKNYIDRGLTTPEMIMTKYTPHSNGSWAESVNQWIAEMEFNDRQKGREATSDADLTEYLSVQ